VILSDRSIREAIEAGRIVIDPLGDNAVQPSSVDVRMGNSFRVFANHRHPYIDVRADQELTELVEATEDEPFILHPGEFVLGTTLEKVTIPDDLVARLEGKSSLARLGLLIHSSLPADEEVLFRYDGETRLRRIGDIVSKGLQGSVVSFDPETFEASYADVTGWYEGPPDRIHEVVLASGRRVRVTAGHNLFTLDREGALSKVRTGQLAPGMLVAVPRRIPCAADATPALDILDLAPETAQHELLCSGPTVTAAFSRHRDDLHRALEDAGLAHGWYDERKGQLPVAVARQVPGLVEELGAGDRVRVKGSRGALPARLPVTEDLAWLLGLYAAQGHRRRNQIVLSNTDQAVLDRVESVLRSLELPVYRTSGAVTCCCTVLSSLIRWIGMGGKAHAKRVPVMLLGWPDSHVQAFYDGFVDGDGSREETRDSLWTCSAELASELLLLATRLGRRAAVSSRTRGGRTLHQVCLPHAEHELLTSVPLRDRLLVAAREAAGLDVAAVPLARLDRLVDGDLSWDRVVEVRDTGRVETIYDLEVRPGGRKIENFLAGSGGVYVSNTAGFVDAGWSGHLTLELSNVANLPITLYPGMKIGQLAFFQLDRPAEVPYGSRELGSKYQGQVGPTASRYFENFDSREALDSDDAAGAAD
jgi:deoxycytidine triphosphate deaminase